MLLAILVFVGGPGSECYLIRPILRFFALKQLIGRSASVPSAVLSCFGVFYGLLLGLLEASCRVSKPDRASKNLSLEEASCLPMLWRACGRLP